MSLIDHDLQDENRKDSLGIDLVPFTGYEVNRHCPLCHVNLREYPQEQGGVDEGIMTVGSRLECPKCNRYTRYYRDMEKAAAAVKEWKP